MINYLNDSMKNRVPLIGHFEITHKCPYKCAFCYNHIESKEELSTPQIFFLINKFAEAGCLHINISGGEPLCHPDFVKIYKYIIKKGIRVSIETNASTLSESTLDILIKYPPIKILISMYGISEDIHRKVTNSSVLLETVKENIIRLQKNKINIFLRTPVSKDNFTELHLLRQYAAQNNIEFNYDPKIWWNQSGERKFDYRCTSSIVEKLKDVDPIYQDLFKKLEQLETRSFAIRSCRWGENEFYVNPYGEMHYCIVFWSNKYNLLSGSFEDAWHNWYMKYRANGCIGRKIYPTDGNCPSGYLYFHKNLDTSKTIEELLIQNSLKI